jgi:hypothetical protein
MTCPPSNIELAGIGASVRFAKLVLFVYLLGTSSVPLIIRGLSVVIITAVTALIGLAVFADTVAATTVVALPPPLEGLETQFRWLTVGVSVGVDPFVMALLPSLMTEMGLRKKAS